MASPSALGKRKERSNEDKIEVKAESTETDVSKVHGATLFVSNLPYTATSTDLQTLFSDIGPVKSAFVVTEQGTGVSKGVGYVTFAMKEDADSAFEKLSGKPGGESMEIAGRKLRGVWADNKPKTKGDHRVKPEGDDIPKPKPRPEPRQHVPHDPLAIRTIIISGLPSGINSKVLWKKVRKYAGAEKVDYPVGDEETEGEGNSNIAHVLFETSSQAQDAAAKLHAHVYKGSLLSVALKKRLDTLAKSSVPKVKGANIPKASTSVPSHASRLIVRNIPFNATEQDLRAVFLPYGPIYSIHIPNDDRPAKPRVEGEPEHEQPHPTSRRTKGFAFVWMLSKKDAERAMEGCNGMTLRSGMADELVRDKQKRKKVRRLEKKQAEAEKQKKAKEGGKDEGSDEEEASGDDEEMDVDDDAKRMERVIAVDWALSKDKWEKEKAKLEEDDADAKMSGSSADEDSESEDSGSGGSSDEVEDSASDDDDSDDLEEDDDDDGDRGQPTRPSLPAPEEGTTLFVRNIPFEATDDDLRTLFRAFGPLRYARIAMDPITGRSRGTGFACFWNVADADRAVHQSELLRQETSGASTSAPKKNPFSLPSLLTPDPSSFMAASLVLHGRTLDVVRAVTRDVATKLKETNERAREKEDKRNTYLLREGVILSNASLETPLQQGELERRIASFNSRKQLLNSNPSLFVSKTRLSVRQIPTFVSEKLLKKLAMHAIKMFQKEVKEGKRQPLSEAELHVDPDEEGVASDGGAEKPKRTKQFFRPTPVKQSKIVRQAERVDPISGKGRSKGYGFIEMQTHADALRVLRWANNNPGVNELFVTWYKEELERILEAEKAKGKVNDKSKGKGKGDGGKEKEGEVMDEDRIKRIRSELENWDVEEGEGKKKARSRGTLIVECSIENVQVVQRRKERETADKTREPTTDEKPLDVKSKPGKDARKSKSKSKATADAESEQEDEQNKRPNKKRRVSDTGGKTEGGDAEAKKSANPLGSIIGRKRKERKSGKGKK